MEHGCFLVELARRFRQRLTQSPKIKMRPPRRALEAVLPSRAYFFIRTLWRHSIRIKKEGLRNVYLRRRLWPKILQTPPVRTEPLTDGCELSVHLMCYQADHLSALWALKSFYHQTKSAFPLMIRIQGSSSPVVEKRLRAHFPNARIVLQQEADRVVEQYLRDHHCPRLLNFRTALPTVQKLTDVLVLSTSRHVLMFDADVLFFQYPEELVEADAGSGGRILFQRDFMEAYSISPARAKADLDIDLQSHVNSGIVRLPMGSVDLIKCEEYLSHPDFRDLEGHTEQTLFALEASRNAGVAFLPSTYLVSLEEDADCAALKARHYAGPSRSLLTRQGIPYLIRSGFLRSLENDCLRPSADAVEDRL